jgi:hypothetical protein
VLSNPVEAGLRTAAFLIALVDTYTINTHTLHFERENEIPVLHLKAAFQAMICVNSEVPVHKMYDTQWNYLCIQYTVLPVALHYGPVILTKFHNFDARLKISEGQWKSV